MFNMFVGYVFRPCMLSVRQLEQQNRMLQLLFISIIFDSYRYIGKTLWVSSRRRRRAGFRLQINQSANQSNVGYILCLIKMLGRSACPYFLSFSLSDVLRCRCMGEALDSDTGNLFRKIAKFSARCPAAFESTCR